MSGSSIGFTEHVLANARIAGPARYTPSYIKQGEQKPVSQRAEFNVYVNDNNGRTNKFRVTAWGRLADSIARSGSPGKEVTIKADINSYEGRVTYQDTQGNLQFVINPTTGQPLTTTKVGFVVRQLVFGNDSDKQIANEISAGLRPQFWNVPGHQDATVWDQEKKRRNSEQFQYGNTRFGFATVQQIPQGAQYAAPNNGNVTVQNQNVGNPNAVAQNMQPNPAAGMNNQPNGMNPAGTMNANPNPEAGNPVMVNGQNMGYPVNQNTGTANAQPVAPNPAGGMGQPAGGTPAVQM